MDPQKTSSPSSDSDKPKENMNGSADAYEDPKPWDDNHESDKSMDADKPSEDTASSETDADKPADTAAGNADAPEGDKIAINNWTDSDKSADVDASESPESPADPKPEVPVSAPAEPAAEVTAAVPAVPASIEPKPAIPSWPGAPAAASPSMPASTAPGTPGTKTKKGLLIVLVIAIVVLILGGGAAAAYFGYVVPNKPENVLKTALVNEFNGTVDSEHFDGKVAVKDKQSDMTLTGTFNGGMTKKGAFDIHGDLDAVVTKIKLDMRSTDGDTVYVRVSGLNGLPELLKAYGGDTSAADSTEIAAYASIISVINNQWIEINQSVLSQLGVTGTDSFKLTDADRTKIANAYGNHEFLSIQEKLAGEKINDMDSYHYKVAINKAELKDFMTELKNAKLDSMKLTQDDLDQFNDAVKNVDFTKYPVDVWVNKDKKLIDQVSFTYSTKDVSLDMRLSTVDYKPVTVTKPTGAKSLLEVISQMYSSQLDNSTLMQELQSNGISL
jgi:hypothetical protein